MDSELVIFGGNPKIVASRDEISRCQYWIKQALVSLDQAKTSMVWQETLFGFDIPNPIVFISLRLKLDEITEVLRQLDNHLFLASEAYFSTEVQLAHKIENEYLSVAKKFPWNFMMFPMPRLRYVDHPYAPLTAAMAVVGLTAPPSTASVGAIRSAASLAPATWSKPAWPFGAARGQNPESVPGLLAQLQGNLFLLGIRTIPAVSATMIDRSTATAASSFSGHMDKLKASYFNPASAIHIDAFKTKTGRDLIVYVPGTQSNKLSGDNPFHVGSNISAMTSTDLAASERSLRQALDQLGAGKGDRVLFVGHSQGGIISSNIAIDKNDFEVAGLIGVGAPLAHQNLEIPVISIEHSNDIVPALSGKTNPLSENWVTVQHSPEAETIVDAHSMNTYIKTAELMDLSTDIGLREVYQKMNFPTGEGVSYKFKLSG